MTTNQLDNIGLNSNPLGKTPRSNAPESKRFFHSMRERSGIEFKLGHALRENSLTKRNTSLLSGERKKKRRCVRTIVSNRKYLSQLIQERLLRHNKT